LDPVDDDSLPQGPTPPAEIEHAKEDTRRDGRPRLSYKKLAAKFHHRGVILER